MSHELGWQSSARLQVCRYGERLATLRPGEMQTLEQGEVIHDAADERES